MKTKILALCLAMTTWSARAGAQDSTYLLLEDYVNSAIARLPGQVLPGYASQDFVLFDTLASNLHTVTGLPQDEWCTAALDAFVLCDGSQPLTTTVGGSATIICNMFPPGTEAGLVTAQLAATQLGADSIARYVVFYRPMDPVPSFAFAISLPGPFSSSQRYCVAAPNSVGPGAQIDLTGSTSLAGNDLVMRAGPVPDQPGLFFLGTQQVQLPFGDGFRCVGGEVLRLPPEQAIGGVLEHAADFTNPASAASQLTAGSTWFVQAWYRDTAAGGAGFNLSDALTLFICP